MRHPLPLLSLLLVLVTACGGTRQATVAPPAGGHAEPGDHTQASDQRARVMRLFMDASQARLNGQPGKATALFEQCIKLDPANHAAMFEMAKLLHMQQRPIEALAWARWRSPATRTTSGIGSCWPTSTGSTGKNMGQWDNNITYRGSSPGWNANINFMKNGLSFGFLHEKKISDIKSACPGKEDVECLVWNLNFRGANTDTANSCRRKRKQPH